MMKLAVLVLAAVAAATGTHKVSRNTGALEFLVEWPAEAVAIPKLDLQLYREAKRNLSRAEQDAAADQALARRDSRDFHPHFFSMSWTVAGHTRRVLSLENELGTFTGGAHPNHNNGALLWDRRLDREVTLQSLFIRPAELQALTRGNYCRKLDRERLSRRGEKIGGPFDECPKYSELAIAPVDRNGSGRFERLRFTASPYTAGPYAEGEYVVELMVSPRLIAALKPEYRPSFEAQRQ